MARNGRGGLGRGLNSLLGGAYEEAIPQEESQRVRVEARAIAAVSVETSA